MTDTAPTTTTYRAYRPRPIAAAERDMTTFLFGGLNWRAEAAFEAAFASAGIKARALPPPTRHDLVTGRELADIGQCCPTAFVTGNLANTLLALNAQEGQVASRYAYVTAGSCGACRFGQYHQSYELALRNLGLEDFRIFLLDQGNPATGAAAGLGPHLLLGAILGTLMTDVVQDIEYQIRPYELEPGATDRAVRAAVEDVCQMLRARPFRAGWPTAGLAALVSPQMTATMRRIRRHFQDIQVDRLRVKPKVKLTGEFYLQTVEGAPNYNIHSWLESEGVEVYPAAITVWLDYLLRMASQEAAQREGIVPRSGLRRRGLDLAGRVLRWHYNRLRAALSDLAHDLPDQRELARLAAPFFDSQLSGGEGDMLVGKAIWAKLHRKAHMICELSPYSCMPNTMSVGAMSAVLGQHPDLLYAPLEIKGDSEIHALSRCQMVLTEAKARARQEYQAALNAAGLTEATARARLAQRPDLSRALTPVPRRGAVGTAANIVLELGGARL